MERPDKLLALSQTLPGLENFLREVLSKEGLSNEADQQRREFLKKLELVSSPPSLPPRPAKLERTRPPLPNVLGSELVTSGDESQDTVYSHYKNNQTDDPVAFAKQQRELSRNYTFYGAYAGRRDLASSELPVLPPSAALKPSPRGSTRSSSSDDTIYERLSIGGDSIILDDSKTSDSHASDSKISYETSPNTSTGIARGTQGRASMSKGKLATAWFKKETKVQEEVYVTDLSDNIIQGYLKDMKANKRRWCVIKDEKLYIFKTRDDPAMHIIDLPNCNIGVDDKKKISYSFRLSQQNTGSPLVHLAIEEGHDLSPWMSAVMAAAVRRSSTYRPISPLENAFDISYHGENTLFPFGFMKIDIRSDEEGDGTSNTYEIPIELLPEMISSSGYMPTHSTPIRRDNTEDSGYDAPLPPLPKEAAMDDATSSSDSSSDDDEAVKKEATPKERKKNIEQKPAMDTTDSIPRVKSFILGPEGERIYDKVPEEMLTPRTDGHSAHRLSYMGSDEEASSDPREDRSGSLSRKRSSTVLRSVSQDSLGSETELMPAPKPPRKTSLLYAPRMKRRRRQTSPECERKFLQDQEATHSGILFQKRPLGVSSKRYCKLIGNQLICYRHPEDEKPSISLSLLGFDVTLTDSKESKRAYAFRISRPNSECFLFSTDSRVSVERWIEVLSLAATGRQDIIAPYPPYFRSAASAEELERRKSLDSLSLSESYQSVDSADMQDDLDDSFQSSSPSKSISSMNAQEDPYYDTSGFAADEREDSDARELESESQRQRRGRRSPKSSESRSPRSSGSRSPRSPKIRQQRQRDRILKRRKEKITTTGSGTESPTTMSPPHSVFVSDSGPENKPGATDDSSCTPESKDAAAISRKEKKGWADTLKLKQSRFGRAHTLTSIVTGSASHETTAKNKQNPQRKRSIPSYTHLLPLFDKEGRFKGCLTQVKASKYSTTQLRRWCVVKNGALQLYNKEGDETPVAKYNLVEMWLTDESDETKHKYFFVLHGVDDTTIKFQVSSKDDFEKWMSVLKIFTEIRVERPIEVTASDDTLAQPTLTKSFARTKHEGSSAAETSTKRSSIRLKFPQRMNVIDMFKKSNSSYNFENANTEDVIPTNELKCVNYSGGYLTEICIADEDNYTWKQPRWVSVKDSELLVFTDSSTGDPIKRIVLYNVNVEDTSEPDREIFRFKIHRGNEVAVFLAHDQADLDNWLKLLRSARDMYGKETTEGNAKCRIPSPKGVFAHNRSRSETLPQTVSQSSASWYSPSSDPEKRKSYGSTSVSTDSEGSTDLLMNGHLQEVIRGHERATLAGSRGELDAALVNRWCVVTSEKLFIFDESDDSKTPLKEWSLADVRVKEEFVDTFKGMFGFRVQHDDEEILLQNANRDVVAQWLSVLLRYCAPIESAQSPVIQRLKLDWRKPPAKSTSDSNLKSAHTPEQDSKIKRTLSEGRASGRRLLRKISEDNILRKCTRSDLFKSASWKGSLEKLNVKLRDKSQLSSYARDVERRFSCGSLFDSEGKYSGYLVEQTATALCRSQVRRWCVVQDEFLFVYDQPRMEKARRTIPLIGVKLTNESDFDGDVFVFRLEYEDGQSIVFRATGRTDVEKWITAISVKVEVLKARAQRGQRRRTVVIDEEVEPAFSDNSSSSSRSTSITTSFSEKDGNDLAVEDLPTTEPLESREASDLAGVDLHLEDAHEAKDALEETEKEGVEDDGSNHDYEIVTAFSTSSGPPGTPSSPHLLIVDDMKRVSLQDVVIEDAVASPDPNNDVTDQDVDVINLGTVKVAWDDVSDNAEDDADESRTPRGSISSEPDDEGCSRTSEPIYENIPGGLLAGDAQNSMTLSGLTIHAGDLGSERPHSHDDTMFVDMLPRRDSRHSLEPLYENVRFVAQDSTTPTRESLDLDEEFGLKVPSEPNTPSPSPTSVTKEFERFSLQDRFSFTSDYSGIVGENFLDEVDSVCSSNKSRSGTGSSRGSSSETSRGSTSEMRAINPAFDKDLLCDILGFPISQEEAQEISEFCTQCDANADEEDHGDIFPSELDELKSPTVIFSSDNCEETMKSQDGIEKQSPEKPNNDTLESLRDAETALSPNTEQNVNASSNDANPRGSLAESSSSSIHDTYFGCSTSSDSEEFVDCSSEKPAESDDDAAQPQDADSTLEASSIERNSSLQEESAMRAPSSRDVSFQSAASRCSIGSSASGGDCDTYFGRSSESDLEKSTEEGPHPPGVDPSIMDDESILMVGPVVTNGVPDKGLPTPCGDETVCQEESKGNDITGGDVENNIGLSSSQVDIIRAVTEAFQGIMEIAEDHPAEDTKL